MSPAPVNPPIDDQVRRTLHASAPVDTHVETGLADLQDRLAGQALGVTPVPIRSGWSAPRRVLAMAAVVVLVAGIGAAVIRRGDQPSRLITQQTPATTGWYVPVGLPDEWKVTAAGIGGVDHPGPAMIPTAQRVWVSHSAPVLHDGDETSAVVALYQAPASAAGAGDPSAGTTDGEPASDTDLGSGITAAVSSGDFLTGAGSRAETTVDWQEDGTRWVVYGRGLSEERTVEAARTIVGAEHLEDPPLDGFELVDQTDQAQQGALVRVAMTNTRTGAVVGYVLSPPGSQVLSTNQVPTTVEIGGATGPLVRTPGTPDGTGDERATYLGRWPGADVSSGPESLPASGDAGPVTDEDVQAVLASLRPASAEEWAAFLRTAPVELDSVEELSVPTLGDVVDGGTRETSGTTSPDRSEDDSVTQTTSASDAGELRATDLQLRPVLSVARCGAGDGDLLEDVAGEYCFALGPVAADGTDLFQAEATRDQGWAVTVRARPGSVDALNELFNACFDAEPTCPANSESGRGAVAIVLAGRVISSPEVNGADLADDAFTIAGTFTEEQGRDLAAAIDAG